MAFQKVPRNLKVVNKDLCAFGVLAAINTSVRVHAFMPQRL